MPTNGRPGLKSYPPPIFPGGVASGSQLAVATNRLQTRLALACAPSDGAITVQNIAGIVQYSLLSIDAEIVMVTAPPVGNSCTVQRGFDGTTPAAHTVNAQVSGFIDAWHHNSLAAEVIAIENVLGTSPIPHAPPYDYNTEVANKPPVPHLPPYDYNTEVSNHPPITILRYWQVEDYNWDMAIPGQALAVGYNNIAMPYQPPGFANGSWAWIADGSNSELVNVSGMTGLVITVNCAHTHAAGAWRIQSPTGGIQEAVIMASTSGGGTVQLARGNTTIHQTIFLADGVPFTIQGYGYFGSQLLVASGFAGDVFVTNSPANAGVFVTWKNFSIAGNGDHPSGYGIHITNNTSGHPIIENVWIMNTFGGVWVDNANYITIDKLFYSQSTFTRRAEAGVKVTGAAHSCSSFKMTNSRIEASLAPSANFLQYGLRVEVADGLFVSNCSILGDVGISIYGGAGKPIGSVNITDCEIDTCQSRGIDIVCDSAVSYMYNVRIADCHIITDMIAGNPSFNGGIFINIGSGAIESSIIIANNWIASSYGHGISALGAKDLIVTGNTIWNNGQDPAMTNAAGIALTNCLHFNIVGNMIYDTQPTHTQKYGITFGGNPLDGYIHKNIFWAADNGQTALLNYTFVGGTVSVKDNKGWNPLGIADITPGASPYTYTAGLSPETIYLYGGTITSVTKQTHVIATSSNVSIQLEPNDSIVITYSAAPSMRKDVH